MTMTKTYALKRLLEHGELRFAEMVRITGWPYSTVEGAVRRLMECGLVEAKSVGPHRNTYRLAA